MDADIRNWSREEDYIVYLARRREGDPIPEGVSPENPFSANPWDFYEDSWYHYEESYNEKNWEGAVRRTEAGLWKWSGTVTIPTEPALGFRNAFEFYRGNTFVGTRTGWRMHQYSAGPNKGGSTRENVSLCRLFWSNEERVNSSALNNSPAGCAGLCTLGSNVIASKEGREVLSRREADETLLADVSQDSYIELKDITASDGEVRELDDHLSERDYMEFDDILTSDTASTSSGNSSNISVSSNEYLNIDELLGEITRHGSVPVDDEECDRLSCFTGPVQLEQDDRDKMLNGNMTSDKENNDPYHHFSSGDYLELRDLFPSNMASAISGNLGCFGRNSAEHFDVDELLRDIAMDGIASVQEHQDNSDCLACIENSIRMNPVSLTGAASVASCTGKNTESADKEQLKDQPDRVPDVGPSTSSCSRAGQVKRNLSERSEGVSGNSSSDDSSSNDDSSFSGSTGSGHDGYKKKSSSKTPQSKRRRSVMRLADIGKKFFCFK